MKAEEFVFALNEANDKFITEPFEENKTAKILHFKKWAALAVCICLIVASATVVIAESFDIGIKFFDYQRNDFSGNYTAEGYELVYEVDYYSLDSFGPMKELKAGLESKGKRIMHVSELPPEERESFIEFYGAEYAEIDVLGEHQYAETFSDREAAIEYIGFEGLEFPDELKDETARICLIGSAYPSVEIAQICIELKDDYINLDEEPDILFYYSAKVEFAYSENYGKVSLIGNEGDTFVEERYTNENGIEYLVVKLKTAEGKTRRINAFLIKNDILYEASMYGDFAKEEFEKHEDFIHNWANSY